MQPIITFVAEADEPMTQAPATVSVEGVEECDSAAEASVGGTCWSLSRNKRAFDCSIALLVMAVFWLPMLLIAICIRMTSRGPALFVQKRVGQNGRLFTIYKFRSMAASSIRKGSGLTMAGDARVTRIGKWLRILKLDELPQFYNVLRGDMSIVGPRPKLPEYAEALTLAYRPGLTGAASLAFRREEEILAQVHVGEMEAFYQSRIKPLKGRIDDRYMAQATLGSDFRIIFTTFLSTLLPHRYPGLKFHDLQGPVEAETAHTDKRAGRSQSHTMAEPHSAYSRAGIAS